MTRTIALGTGWFPSLPALPDAVYVGWATMEPRELVEIPRIREVEAPPVFSLDLRQKRVSEVMAGISDSAETAGIHLSRANLVSGFYAASVDLGKLKAVLEAGISDFTRDQLEQRWQKDVHSWLVKATMQWVQRVKRASFRLREKGIAVELQTQDDLGYYEYRFDVFAGR